MLTVRMLRRCGATLAFVLISGCAGDQAGAPASDASSAFCATVGPKVDAYLASATQEHPVPDDPRYGGTVVVATVGDFRGGMNPAVSTDYNGTQYQLFALLMTLVRYDADLQPVPYLARSWEINADTTRLTFHLRGDVTWDDGEPTTARDVAFTYRLVTNPETGFPNPAYWDEYGRGDDAVEVVDDTTVVFALHPHADFLDPWRATPILPEHLLGDVPPAELANHPFTTECPVGNGPYVFEEHRLNEYWAFRANPGFPAELGGRPYPDRLVHRIIPEQTTLLTELLTGGIQAYIGVQPDQAEQVQADPAVELLTYQHRQTSIVAWNARRPQLSDARVRRALTLGMDREGIVRAVLKGYGTVVNSTVPPTHWQYDPSVLPDMSYNPEAAEALLGEAGWKDRDGDGVRENAEGEPLRITVLYNQGSRQRQSIAELMQAQLAKIGVDIRIQVLDVPTLSTRLFQTKDFDAVITSWIADFRLDDRDLFDSHRIDGPWAMSGTNDPELDRYLDTLQTVVDRTKAKPLWDAYQRRLVEVQPYTFLYIATQLLGVRKSLHDVRADTRGDLVALQSWWLDPAAR